MFANRFTVLVDACVLVSPLRRNLILSLAAAEFSRIRWSDRILDETEHAIAKLIAAKGQEDVSQKASRTRRSMERAFEDAAVTDYESLIDGVPGMADPNDAHVLAAALKARASLIVTDNVKHFPRAILAPLDLEAKTADTVIADTVDHDADRAVAAVRQMRQRFRAPPLDPAGLLLRMAMAGLSETVDSLHGHILML